MCLIVVKPKGKQLPTTEKMQAWFEGHPDGFGLAFPYHGRVRILKGAMDTQAMSTLLCKMERCLDKVPPQDVDIVFHFRQATTGQITPANCHPFPLTKNQKQLGALDIIADCALAHNGMIYDCTNSVNYNYYTDGYDFGVRAVEPPKESKTDTQQFIEEYLVDLGDTLWNPAVQKLIEACSNSKFALLSNKGITYIGAFVEEDGYWYSNNGYKPFLSITPLDINHPAHPYYDWKQSKQPKEGPLCDGCSQGGQPLYYMPADDASIVCFECFQHFVGRPPEAEEQVYW